MGFLLQYHIVKEIPPNQHVLHLANDFSGSKVYKNLFEKLDDKYGVQQTVYTAVRSKNLIGLNQVSFQNKDSRIFYRHILNNITRVHYWLKLNRIVADIESSIDLKKVNLIHAHTWYSDGGVALMLSRKYKIPFIVTVRSSDTEIFLRYMLHLRRFGREILLCAHSVVFITPVYLKRVQARGYFRKVPEDLQAKWKVIPNALDDFWLNRMASPKNQTDSLKAVKLIYVGTFLVRKNVPKIIESVEILRKNGVDVSLTMIGGGGRDHEKIMKRIKGKPYYHYLGKVHDKERLLEAFRDSTVFVMPSKRETFGLVYLEAMSQALPLIYLEDDGIDGMFGGHVGLTVNNRAIVQGIVNAVNTIITKPENFNYNPKDILNGFAWSELSSQYMELYHSAIGNGKPIS